MMSYPWNSFSVVSAFDVRSPFKFRTRLINEGVEKLTSIGGNSPFNYTTIEYYFAMNKFECVVFIICIDYAKTIIDVSSIEGDVVVCKDLAS